jgi:hypothetical protein
MKLRNIILEALTLFSSFGTLLCCAIPALLVSIGAGAALASIVSTVPQLVWISEHKVPLFIFAGLMILVSAGSTYWNRNAPCPVDPIQARSCRRVRRISFALLFVSLAIYATGFYFAFLAVGGS